MLYWELYYQGKDIRSIIVYIIFNYYKAVFELISTLRLNDNLKALCTSGALENLYHKDKYNFFDSVTMIVSV